MEHTLDYKTPPKYYTYRKRHKAKFGNIKMISENEFLEITSHNCHYCGVAGPNGIDRIDSTIGYKKTNCVPCCKHCNYVKGNLQITDFNVWTKRFVTHQTNNGK